jgi:hypothetical protein
MHLRQSISTTILAVKSFRIRPHITVYIRLKKNTFRYTSYENCFIDIVEIRMMECVKKNNFRLNSRQREKREWLISVRNCDKSFKIMPRLNYKTTKNQFRSSFFRFIVEKIVHLYAECLFDPLSGSRGRTRLKLRCIFFFRCIILYFEIVYGIFLLYGILGRGRRKFYR